MINLYLIAYTSDNVPSPETSPDFSQFEVVASDEFFVIVEADNAGEVQAEVNGYPYWQWIGHPAAGAYISQSGDVVYIDRSHQIVDSAEVVCRSLGVEFGAFEDCDDILRNEKRWF